MTAWANFVQHVKSLQPRSAIVLGSGLGDATASFHVHDAIPFGEIPGLVPPTIAGHKGQLQIGHWGTTPGIVCAGRVHFYEGHAWNRVLRLVELFEEFGVQRLLLTNAAGGIRDDLAPGNFMPIQQHIKLLDNGAWTAVANAECDLSPYTFTSELCRLIEAEFQHPIQPGTYAALTGPCYETPAEIRALRAMGADAVGMSTAREAERANELGMQVAGLSVITNKAAGLSNERLSHAEVEVNARLALDQLTRILPQFARSHST